MKYFFGLIIFGMFVTSLRPRGNMNPVVSLQQLPIPGPSKGRWKKSGTKRISKQAKKLIPGIWELKKIEPTVLDLSMDESLILPFIESKLDIMEKDHPDQPRYALHLRHSKNFKFDMDEFKKVWIETIDVYDVKKTGNGVFKLGGGQVDELNFADHVVKEMAETGESDPDYPQNVNDIFKNITNVKTKYKLNLMRGKKLFDNIFDLAKLDSPLKDMVKEVGDMHGIATPYYLFGGKFSTSPIHTEDYNMASINLMLSGHCAIWVLVDPSQNQELVTRMKEETNETCDQFLHGKEYAVSPQRLHEWGIKYRTIIQKPGDAVVVMPACHHLVINMGWNIKYACNFLPYYAGLDLITKRKHCECTDGKEVDRNITKLKHGQDFRQYFKNLTTICNKWLVNHFHIFVGEKLAEILGPRASIPSTSRKSSDTLSADGNTPTVRDPDVLTQSVRRRKCPRCPRIVASSYYSEHFKTHLSLERHVCHFCGQTFKTKRTLERHLKHKHTVI